MISVLEVILFVMLTVMIAAYYALFYQSKKEKEDIEIKLHKEREELYNLAQSGVFDSLLNVKKFNNWFNSPKDKEMYAHPGIFLRTDKLSQHHFDDFIKMSTNGLLTCGDFDFKKMYDFENRVRDNWIKQSNKK